MPSKQIHIGMVGYQFMGKAHSNAWANSDKFFDLPVQPVMQTLCGRTLPAVKKVAQQWGWQNAVTDFRSITDDPAIDLVDIATPNDSHADIAIAAAESGKAVACEKPLARTWSEGKQMHAAVKKARVKNYVWFNYRRVPAIAFAQQLVRSGRIGRIFHVRARYLQSWIKDPQFPFVWRLSKASAGSGALGDLCAHSIDLLRAITGEEFTEVSALLETFIKQRPAGKMTEGLSASRAKSGRGAKSKPRLAKVDVDDAVCFLTRLSGGAVGTFEATRFATGHHNGNTIEINGNRGSLRFNFPNFSFLEFFDDTLPHSEKGWRQISCTTADHDYARNYWPPDHPIGYAETFTSTAADILTDLANPKRTDYHANFDDALECQRVMEAVTRSARDRRWVATKEIT